MSTRLHSFPFLVFTLSLAGCGGNAPEAAPPAPVALVEVQPAATRTLRETLSAYGTTEFATADAVTLAVQVESQVAALLVTPGAEVKRGQTLLRLAPSPMTRLDFDKSRRDADVAAAERERLQRLRSQGLATESELQTAVNAAATAAALRDSLAARVGPGGVQTLYAPRDGIVDVLNVRPGDVLAPGAVAVRIAAPDALQVRLGVEPEDTHLVAAGQPVRLAPLNPGAATVTAAVSGIDRRVDPQTHLAAALVRLPAGSGLLPGAALRAEIVVATRGNAVAVPRAALLYAGEQPYVFVVTATGDKVQRREVKTGTHDGDDVEITDGLKAGEPVVVSGNVVLEDGMTIRTQPAPERPPAAADVIHSVAGSQP